KSECSGGAWQGPSTGCQPNPCPVVLTPFVDALPIPVAANPVSGMQGGAASYRIRVFQTKQKLHRDLPLTTVWGYDDGGGGGYPGPTLEARSGQPIDVTWVNDLRDDKGALRTTHVLSVDTCLHGAKTGAPPIVVHLHGGHVPSRFDGQPEMT